MDPTDAQPNGQNEPPSAGAAPPGRARASATRTGRTWLGLSVGVLALVLVLVFIFQNLQAVKVTFFTASGTMPLALAILVAAVLGALTLGLVGSVRIVQLRRQVKRSPPPGAPRPSPGSPPPGGVSSAGEVEDHLPRDGS